ncbi:MAG: isochorismatase family protein [Pseudomonadota bacterium]
MQALLVIDMQTAYLRGETVRLDLDGVISRINHAASCMRARGGKVVFIRHNNEEAALGSAGWQVDSALVVEPGDSYVNKEACDSFSGTTLAEVLSACGASTLYMCGMATEFCVDTTVRAALSRGFDVVALSDAHTTGDRPHLTASQIVAHHNWTWENIAAPARRKIHVLTVADAFAA